MQLAIAAIESKILSERKAAIYYCVSRTTLQHRQQGMLTRTEAHAHERRLTAAQEDVLVEWVKVHVLAAHQDIANP